MHYGKANQRQKPLAKVKKIVQVASRCTDDIGVHDEAGAIADAKKHPWPDAP